MRLTLLQVITADLPTFGREWRFCLVLIDGVLLHCVNLMKKLALFAEDIAVELLFWCD